MEIIILLVVWVACAIWCNSLAKKQGRNPGIAIALGLLFGFIAVIGYYVAGDKN